MTNPLHTWQTSASPAELVNLCGGADGPMRERLRAWAIECDKLLCSHHPSEGPFDPNNALRVWTGMRWNDRHNTVKSHEAAALLRCIVPAQTCPACDGKPPEFPTQRGNGTFRACSPCSATGLILTPPAIDPQWLSGTVMGLVRGIAGVKCSRCAGTGIVRSTRTTSTGKVWKIESSGCAACRTTGKTPPDFDPARLAALSNFLEESGCTDDWILTHLRESIHCPECWVIKALLETSNLKG